MEKPTRNGLVPNDGMNSKDRAGGALTIRELMPLVGLTFSAFILNTSEFMPIGLLTDIAGSFSINEATCGLMITAQA